jgi:hypothetical protein
LEREENDRTHGSALDWNALPGVFIDMGQNPTFRKMSPEFLLGIFTFPRLISGG